jgi:Na+-transporting NADH:ubiquinone oxidoreductase subunit NqrD
MAAIGTSLAVFGLVIEGISVAGMASHAIRKRLPIKSPMDLVGIGAFFFFLGVILAAIGK